jgi:general secretion pathway protein E
VESYAQYLPRWREALGSDIAKVKVRGAEDCPNCGGLGVKGRTVVAEVIWIDEQGRYFIKKLDNLAWEKYLRQQGWTSFSDRTLELLKEGKCDPLDAEKVMGSINVAFSAKAFDYKSKVFEEENTK